MMGIMVTYFKLLNSNLVEVGIPEKIRNPNPNSRALIVSRKIGGSQEGGHHTPSESGARKEV